MRESKGTILIADDEPDSLALLSTVLTSEGYQVRAADSGKLALASALASPPDLILLDMRMPGMDGLEVCRRLKADPNTKDVPLMFLSGSTGTEDRVEGLALGAVDFVVKPFFRPELLARVRTHLELGRLRFRLEASVAERTEELVHAVERLEKEISERQRTERALRESEERFRNMANTAPVMIAVSGPDQMATFFNRRWLDFTGRELEEELGRGWIAGVHPDDLQSTLSLLTSTYASRAECEMEYRLRRADGEYRQLLCKGVPRFEPHGGFTGYIASLLDITEMRRSQEEALARQKLESLGILAAGIAHDFNNLLGSIMAESELLGTELPADSPTHAGVERIAAVAIRASGIVRQLMVYAGQESTDFEQIDLSALVREMIDLLKASISKAAALQIDLTEEAANVEGNSAQLRQVIMNLITNASQALGEKDGVISVSVTDVQGTRLRLRVEDTGCGMTDEVQRKIFDPFFSTKGAGRGMGLAAVRGIVRAHGGSISVASTPGHGSCFELVLPRASIQIGSAKDEDRPGKAGNLSGAAPILLIDDEEALRTASAKVLRSKGYAVIDAADGDSGIALFQEHASEIGVVLLDVTLPGLSGSRIVEEFRKMRPDVKVVLISAHARDYALNTMGGDNSLLYLRKPYRIGDLTDLLHTIYSQPTISKA